MQVRILPEQIQMNREEIIADVRRMMKEFGYEESNEMKLFSNMIGGYFISLEDFNDSQLKVIHRSLNRRLKAQ